MLKKKNKQKNGIQNKDLPIWQLEKIASSNPKGVSQEDRIIYSIDKKAE